MYWFWLGRRSHSVAANIDEAITITVDGGVYIPAEIHGTVNQAMTLRFYRIDESPCAQSVIFADLGISQDLPLKQSQDLKITCDKAGVFEFTCPMGMYRGKLIISAD